MGETLPAELIEALAAPGTDKFFATLDEAGKPNLVYLSSLSALGSSGLSFADVMLRKTKKNLRPGAAVAVVLAAAENVYWTMNGIFEEFLAEGPIYEGVAASLNPAWSGYNCARAAGVVSRIDSIERAAVAAPALAWGRLGARLSSYFLGDETELAPPSVRRRFRSFAGAKAAAWRARDGAPRAAPLPALQPASGSTMVFYPAGPAAGLAGQPFPLPVALCSALPGGPSYQLKGTYRGMISLAGLKTGRIEIEEVFNNTPPLCGRLIARRPPE